MTISTAKIVEFLENVIENKEYKRLFTNVWLDTKSIQSLFLFLNKIETVKIPSVSLTKKMNFIAESNTYGLHKKQIFDMKKKVSSFFKVYFIFFAFHLHSNQDQYHLVFNYQNKSIHRYEI